MSVLVDGVLVDPFALTLRDSAGTDVPIHGGLRNVRDAKGLMGMVARVSVRPRIGRSGSVPTTRRRKDRPITIDLQFLGEDTQQAVADYYTLSRAVNAAVDTDRLLRWTLGTYNLESLVRAESIEPPALVAGRILETQIGLRAMDPRAYDQTLNEVQIGVGGTATITNAGSVETPPVYVLVGPLTNPRIDLLPATTLTFNGTIATGVSRTIDVGARTEDSGIMARAVSRWANIAAGGSDVRLRADSGSTGHLLVRTRDAYQ